MILIVIIMIIKIIILSTDPPPPHIFPGDLVSRSRAAAVDNTTSQATAIQRHRVSGKKELLSQSLCQRQSLSGQYNVN